MEVIVQWAGWIPSLLISIGTSNLAWQLFNARLKWVKDTTTTTTTTWHPNNIVLSTIVNPSFLDICQSGRNTGVPPFRLDLICLISNLIYGTTLGPAKLGIWLFIWGKLLPFSFKSEGAGAVLTSCTEQRICQRPNFASSAACAGVVPGHQPKRQHQGTERAS